MASGGISGEISNIVPIIPVQGAFKKDGRLPEITRGRNWPRIPGVGLQAQSLPFPSVFHSFGAGGLGLPFLGGGSGGVAHAGA